MNQSSATASDYGGATCRPIAAPNLSVATKSIDPNSNEAEILKRHESLASGDPLPLAVPLEDTFPVVLGNEVMVRNPASTAFN